MAAFYSPVAARGDIQQCIWKYCWRKRKWQCSQQRASEPKRQCSTPGVSLNCSTHNPVAAMMIRYSHEAAYLSTTHMAHHKLCNPHRLCSLRSSHQSRSQFPRTVPSSTTSTHPTRLIISSRNRNCQEAAVTQRSRPTRRRSLSCRLFLGQAAMLFSSPSRYL